MTPNQITLWYLVASVCFILALKGLSSPETARRGNWFGIAGMTIAVLTTIAVVARGRVDLILMAMLAGGTLGAIVARRVQMTQMPELVAAMHSLVGMAAVLIAIAAVNNPASFGIVRDATEPMPMGNRLELFIGTFVGAITFSGSVIAFGKLAGLGKHFRLFSSAPVVFPGQHLVNLLLALVMIVPLLVRERRIGRFAAVLRGCLADDISLDPQRQVEVLGKPTPVLKNGAADLNLDCTIPDRFTAQTGVTATIFVKSGDDFIRISTSIKKQNGERAIGTALSRAHPGYSRLMAGQSYTGYATLFGTQYLTQYDVIEDARGKVIGALYVGIDVSKQRRMSMATKLSLLTFGELAERIARSASRRAAAVSSSTSSRASSACSCRPSPRATSSFSTTFPRTR